MAFLLFLRRDRNFIYRSPDILLLRPDIKGRIDYFFFFVYVIYEMGMNVSNIEENERGFLFRKNWLHYIKVILDMLSNKSTN